MSLGFAKLGIMGYLRTLQLDPLENVMEYVFYFVILAACVYVVTGIVHSTLFSSSDIERSELPKVVEHDLQALFPAFNPQVVKRQKARHRYQLDGKLDGKPSQVTFALTPESELSILEFRQASLGNRVVKLSSLSNAQVPPKIANQLRPYFADDQAQLETSKAELVMIDDHLVYRIKVDSPKHRYLFDVSETGELLKLVRKDVA